jgi:hypothetical protein
MQEVAPVDSESVLQRMELLYLRSRRNGFDPTEFTVSPSIAHFFQYDPVGALRPYRSIKVSVGRLQIEPVILISHDNRNVPPSSGDEVDERYEGSKSTFESIEMMSDALALKLPTALTEQIGGTHYKDLAIQPAEYCQRNGLSYCESNVVKYVTRHKKKGGLEDIKKAIHNLRLVAHFEYGEELP